tara:strand:+ start:525 stop:1004 length:480 start_codon:yes stop_codon:yes gene_type:complete
MKKIFYLICFLLLIGCNGYKPIFSKKNVNYFIADIDIIKNNRISRDIKKKLQAYKNEDYRKKAYFLKINSEKNNLIVSKDSRGNPKIYKMIIKVDIDIIEKEKRHYFNIDRPVSTIKLEESFSYNNQSNKFDLNRYKKNIEENLTNKIYEKIILQLQIM